MSRLKSLSLVTMVLLCCVFMSKPVFSATSDTTEKVTKIVEGMKQGEFAMLLIKELDAQGLLPPAATTQDAFKFLEKLGMVPPKGWDAKDVVDRDLLISLLGLTKEKAAQSSFDELLDKLKTKLAGILWSMGIRTVAPQTISPAGGS